MKYFHLLIWFTGTISILSCSDSTDSESLSKNKIKIDYPYSVDLVEGMKNNSTFSLSEIADSIKYIVLSKEQDVVLRFVTRIEIDNADIFVNAATEESSFFRFDSDGRFINSIGKIGRGPEEYLGGSIFTICPESGQVYVRRNYTYEYLSYDYDGNYIGNLGIDKHAFTGSIAAPKKNILLEIFTFNGWRKNLPVDLQLFRLFTHNDSTLKSIPHPLLTEAGNWQGDQILNLGIPGKTYFENEIIPNVWFSDTIYKISKDSIYKGFVLDKGKYVQTPDQKYLNNSTDTKKSFRSGSPLFETKTRAYFKQSLGRKKLYLFEYNKKTGVVTSMNQEVGLSNASLSDISRLDQKFRFRNDLDGGIDFFPAFTNRKGDIWVRSISAFDFKTQHIQKLQESTKAVSPEQKQKLMHFLENLKEDDNPVLIMVYLKQNI